MKRKVCVITGTRAEYGVLSNLMRHIQNDETFELQVLVTGMHLSPEFGLTYKQIEEDGFTINEKVEMLLSADTTTAVIKSMGLATIGFADVLDRLKPDLLIILGDRFEMLAAAQSALIMQIPIAHIHGGECTFGAYDDAIRHSITKMATWHFTSNEKYQERVIQLGEHPERTFNVGALSIENILNMPLLNQESIMEFLGLELQDKFFLVTIHPETNQNKFDIQPLIKALLDFKDYKIVFTKGNADNGGREINDNLEKIVNSDSSRFRLFTSLGIQKYLTAAKYASVVIGNSSSGIGEVPYLHTPTVNLGNRQKGRLFAKSIFNAPLDSEEQIKDAIQLALNYKGEYEYLFGNGETSDNILKILKSLNNFNVQKGFFEK